MKAWHIPYLKIELEKLKEKLNNKFDIVYINSKTKKELFKSKTKISDIDSKLYDYKY
ncbi:MAG: hypothetical protein PF487_12560 [Bacteroidales bacterium]|jgi:hypothetical protein|nr:hypothetical protein [Bacteroidales bacterium]